jgi:hypothetical protein
MLRPFWRVDSNPSPVQGTAQFLLVYFSIAVQIYRLKNLPELVFGTFEKAFEFRILNAAVIRGVDSCKDIMYEVVGVFQGCSSKFLTLIIGVVKHSYTSCTYARYKTYGD